MTAPTAPPSSAPVPVPAAGEPTDPLRPAPRRPGGVGKVALADRAEDGEEEAKAEAVLQVLHRVFCGDEIQAGGVSAGG